MTSGYFSQASCKKFCTLKKVQLCGLLWRPLCAECKYKPTHMRISCLLIPKKRKKRINSILNCHKKIEKVSNIISAMARFLKPLVNYSRESIKNHEYFLDFEAKFEKTSNNDEGAWEEPIIEYQRQKISLHSPFKLKKQ
jgi:hypothetical protein